MPVLILLISFCGNLLSYKETGTIYSDTIVNSYLGIEPTPITDSGTIQTFYINTNLNNEEVDSIVLNAGLINDNTFVADNDVYPESLNVYTYYVVDAAFSSDNDYFSYDVAQVLITIFDYHTINSDLASLGLDLGTYFTIIIQNHYNISRAYTSNSIIATILSSMYDFNFTLGWSSSNGVESFDNEYTHIKTYLGNSYIYNEFLVDLFSITPYWEPTIFTDSIHVSLFDKTLNDTDNTFKKFQMPFLRISFDRLFNILNFETSYVSSFVLTSFTWMIQLLLLHVVVDTLSFIFKMYHKLMDRVV